MLELLIVAAISILAGAVLSAIGLFRWGVWWIKKAGGTQWLLEQLHARYPDMYHDICAQDQEHDFTPEDTCHFCGAHESNWRDLEIESDFAREARDVSCPECGKSQPVPDTSSPLVSKVLWYCECGAELSTSTEVH